MITIAAAVFVFAVIVLIHEFGHFITAKLTGMKVEEFAIGFGPKIASVKKGETLYSLRILPLGGFNRIMGMERNGNTDPRAFINRPVWQKLLVISAGAVFNILLAFIIISGVIWHTGIQQFTNTPVVGDIVADSPAQKAGLLAKDTILSVDGHKVDKWTDIGPLLDGKANTVVTLTVKRGNDQKDISVIPEEKDNRTVIGITAHVETTPVSFTDSLKYGADRSAFILMMVGKGLAALITGAGGAEVSGPIGVARAAGTVANSGFLPLLVFTAFLSLNLGFLNLLPIPLLDGGQIILILAEAVYRKPLPEKTLYYIQMTGLCILGGLFFYAMASDMISLFK